MSLQDTKPSDPTLRELLIVLLILCILFPCTCILLLHYIIYRRYASRLQGDLAVALILEVQGKGSHFLNRLVSPLEYHGFRLLCFGSTTSLCQGIELLPIAPFPVDEIYARCSALFDLLEERPHALDGGDEWGFGRDVDHFGLVGGGVG